MGQKPGDLTLQYSNHPISNSYLFFQGDIAADNALQTAMLGAKQQSAIGVQRFGAALDFPVADMDDDAATEGEAMFLPLVGDGLEPPGTDKVIVMVEFLEDFHGEGGAVLSLAGFDFQRGGVLAQLGRKLAGGQVHADADAENDVFNRVQFRAEFREDAGDFFATNENIIGPLDFGREAGLRADGAIQRGGRGDGQLSDGGGAHGRTQQDGEPQTLAGGRHPFAAEASASFGLRLGKDHDAFLHVVARELFDDVIGGGGFLKNANVAAHDGGAAEARQQIVGVQQVRGIQQPVTEVRTGLDFVAERAEFVDSRPDGGAADAEFLRKFRACDAAFAGGAQGGENLGVNGHGSKSRPISTARAEWVSAPTEMKSTPVSAMARMLARLTPPLASVWERPLACWTARRNWMRFILSSRTKSAPAATACSTWSSVSASTSILSWGYCTRARWTAAATALGDSFRNAARWL